ncbi:unnamed protein product [Rhizophagus irregularis]|nr:unnamed protein product [Rhizophagus irregularis]
MPQDQIVFVWSGNNKVARLHALLRQEDIINGGKQGFKDWNQEGKQKSKYNLAFVRRRHNNVSSRCKIFNDSSTKFLFVLFELHRIVYFEFLWLCLSSPRLDTPLALV